MHETFRFDGENSTFRKHFDLTDFFSIFQKPSQIRASTTTWYQPNISRTTNSFLLKNLLPRILHTSFMLETCQRVVRAVDSFPHQYQEELVASASSYALESQIF